jgi:secondary thiamine-phosphate synthase enzyme
MEKVSIKTTRRMEFVDITAHVQRIAAQAGKPSGVCVVFCPHTTAGLTINENADPDVLADLSAIVGRMIPADNGYAHTEGNSDSHMKASVFGPSLSLIIEDSRIQLGRWQGIYFCEADGPRTREVWVKVL